jgi:hypothetical protein
MKKTYTKTLGVVGAALLSSAIVAPAQAQGADELRSQVFALQQRVDALENRGGVKVAPGTTFEFGGYVKLDFMYDFEKPLGFSTGGNFDVNSPDDGGFFAQARESRFNVKSTTQTDTGPVTALIEFDFFTGTGNELISNSLSPRLRHAYGTWNGILAGQYWTLFKSLPFGLPQVNFSSPAGNVFLRQPQIRYTFPKMETTAGTFTFAASLENSENSARFDTGGTAAPTLGGVPKTDQLPDFVTAVDWTNGVQRARGALMLTELNSPISSDSEIGYGISLAFATPLWAGSEVRGIFQYGDGIGRYIITGGATNAGIINTTTGNLQTIKSWGGNLALIQQLTDTVSIAFGGGQYKVEDTFANTDVSQVDMVTATLFYKPNAKVTIGTQFIWASTENAGGQVDEASRWQTSLQFNF